MWPATPAIRLGGAAAAATPAIRLGGAAAAATPAIRLDGAAAAATLAIRPHELIVPPRRVAIVVHGGAGFVSDAQAPTASAGCRTAAGAGLAVLLAGGAALDAVEAAVRVLEDDPFFNAGRGSVLTRAGVVEMDALVVDGRGRRTGAVTMVTATRNPVSLARAVMERTPHVLLGGPGADAFAASVGLPQEPAAYFVTEARRRQLEKALAGGAAPALATVADAGAGAGAATGGAGARPRFDGCDGCDDETAADAGDHDTVGAVAVDADGNVAAATSTGGLTAKWVGRIGDTPLFGAGGWASNGVAAVSTTGTGEYIIRSLLARSVADGLPPATISGVGADADGRACAGVAHALRAMRREVGGPGAGIICVTPDAGVGVGHSTHRMSFAAARCPIPPAMAATATATVAPVAGVGAVAGAESEPGARWRGEAVWSAPGLEFACGVEAPLSGSDGDGDGSGGGGFGATPSEDDPEGVVVRVFAAFPVSR